MRYKDSFRKSKSIVIFLVEDEESSWSKWMLVHFISF